MYKSHNLREHGSSGAGDTVYTWVNTDRHVINGRSVWFLMGGIRGIEREARVTTCGEVLVGICAGREVPRAARRSRWCRVVKHSHDLREHGSSGAVYAVYTWVNTDWYVINGRRVWFHMGGIRGVESDVCISHTTCASMGAQGQCMCTSHTTCASMEAQGQCMQYTHG